MSLDRFELNTALERCLREGLSVLARTVKEVGAQNVSVILLETGGTTCVVYHWPAGSENVATQIPLTFDVISALRAVRQPLIADCAVAQFLNDFATPGNRSFLLLPWADRNIKVIIAFGFPTPRAPIGLQISDETSRTLYLAALATSIIYENCQLRRELFVVSNRLGQRKNVERAKGVLQARKGWSEQQAYEHLRHLSRERRRTLADTAEDILRMSGLLRAEPES